MLVLSEFHASKVNVTFMLSSKNHARGFWILEKIHDFRRTKVRL